MQGSDGRHLRCESVGGRRRSSGHVQNPHRSDFSRHPARTSLRGTGGENDCGKIKSNVTWGSALTKVTLGPVRPLFRSRS